MSLINTAPTKTPSLTHHLHCQLCEVPVEGRTQEDARTRRAAHIVAVHPGHACWGGETCVACLRPLKR